MIDAQGKLPKISCLMVTANGRFDTFSRSFSCYCKQTYPNRQLVIVNEGSKDYQQKISEHVSSRTDVQMIFLDGIYTLGALRNLSIRLSQGDIFCQWDDDDFNTPERLAVQYLCLKRQNAKVCYLSDQLHYYFDSRTLFWESWGDYFSGGGMKKYSLIPGTIMAYRKDFGFRYPSVGEHSKSGEDSVLAYNLCENTEVTLLSGQGHRMIYSFHGKNVYDLAHHQNLSNQRALPISHMLDKRDEISQTIQSLALEGDIRVMGREGLAFIHRGNS